MIFDSDFLYWFSVEYYIFGFKINIIFVKQITDDIVYPIIRYYL